MVRRELPAIPVVGERYEVLGVITAHEALQHLFPLRVRRGGSGGRPEAPGAALGPGGHDPLP